jgi:AbrB family looped-hinge helix DNA binding protein
MTTTRMGAGGRLVIPSGLRKRLGLRPGSHVTLTENVDGDLVVSTPEAALHKLQSLVRRHVPEGVSLVDELLAERRAEAAHDH